MPAPYVLGLNKYSHSASCALLDAEGRPAFAVAKERVTRKKFDGGDVAAAVAYALEHVGAELADVGLVVQSGHLFRVEPFEDRLPFTVGLRHYPASCLDPCNVAGVAWRPRTLELSHHLAHAWGAMLTAPFDEGLVVVMDGMGSLRSEMADGGERYFTDLGLERTGDSVESPAPPDPTRPWREAETVFAFHGPDLRLLFKRWAPLRSPELLHNYGFENMEGLGAVYSRVASHIFGDWNACGKVMGLSGYGRPDALEPIMTGPLEQLRVNWPLLESLGHVNDWNSEKPWPLHQDLAARAQADLEAIALDFLQRLQRRTGARNVVVTGGLALNSQLNGRIAREAGFENVYVPPAPGDDGAALGCAAFGVARERGRLPRRAAAFPPYLGAAHDEAAIRSALDDYAAHLDVARPDDLLDEVARRVSEGRIVGWYQGRSEFGPRALGSRSILAHPGVAGMADTLNRRVKHREPFRPFAPSFLAERVDDYLVGGHPSPYMSFTYPVRPEKREEIPAVTHVDGTSRAQTLRREDNPLYYDLIARFEQITGLPLVLNTSFNLAGEAIVETPADAVGSFMRSEMDALAIGPFVALKRPFPADLAGLTVRAAPDVLVETTHTVEGELSQATLYFRGRGIECGETAVAILELCGEAVPVADVIETLHVEAGVGRDEAVAELRKLYEACVVSLKA